MFFREFLYIIESFVTYDIIKYLLLTPCVLGVILLVYSLFGVIKK